MLFLTSDQHFFHTRALELMPDRPWKTVDEMNEELINNHNSVVTNSDVCIHLGDLVMGIKETNAPKIIPKLHGQNILLPGNHCWIPGECSTRRQKQLEELYLDCGIHKIYYGTVKLSDIINTIYYTNVYMNHFPPYSTSENTLYDYKYKSFMPVITETEFLLCGHTHSRHHLLQPNIYHVGVDAEIHNYKPVNINTILNRLGIT